MVKSQVTWQLTGTYDSEEEITSAELETEFDNSSVEEIIEKSENVQGSIKKVMSYKLVEKEL